MEVLISLISPEIPRSSIDHNQRPELEHEMGSLTIIYRAALRDENTVTPINLTQVRYEEASHNLDS